MGDRAVKLRKSTSATISTSASKKQLSRTPTKNGRRLYAPLTDAHKLFDEFELEVLDEEKHQHRQKRDLLHKLDAAKELYQRLASDPALKKWDEFYRDIDSRRPGIKQRERARIQNEMWRNRAVLGQSSYRSLTQKLKRIPTVETRRSSAASGQGEVLNPDISPVTSAPTSVQAAQAARPPGV